MSKRNNFHIISKMFLSVAFAAALLPSCSFKSKNDALTKTNEAKPYDELTAADLSNMDSDGDSVNDLEESNRGTSPFIADLPKFNLKFMQDFSIKVNYENASNKAVWLIDTKVARTSADFKYRVGDLVIKDIAHKSAADVGSFGDHTHGNFEPRDLSWVKYPEIDSANFQQAVLEGTKLFAAPNKITNISINLENSLKLLPNSLFPEIKDLEVNFYYFDYDKEQYELLKTELIARNFVSDVNESFSVQIDSVPQSFILDNYFKKGEFIYAEVKDFIIPSLNNIKYSELLASIKAKSNQVIITTPKDTQTLYIGYNAKAKNLNAYLQSIFDKNYQIENDRIIRLGEFLNNLDDYQYLSELKASDKTGKWFVLTQKINKHYLDYEFGLNEPVILSYVTGTELSSQSEDRVSSIHQNISAKGIYQVHDLGEITANTRIDLQLKPNKEFGTGWSQKNWIWHSGMVPPCTQCYKREFHCEFKINTFVNFNQNFVFDKNFKKELERFFLVINNEEFAISNLVLEKKIDFKWIGNNLHLKINDIKKIAEVSPSAPTQLKLKMVALKGSVFNGIKWISQRGRDGMSTCYQNLLAYSKHEKVPVSTESIHFEEFKNIANWTFIGQQPSGPKEFVHDQSIDVSVVINNFYN